MENAPPKVAWIVGGSSGLGLAIAAELLAAGYRVTLFARDVDRLEQARRTLLEAKSGLAESRVSIAAMDATDAEAVSRTFASRYQVCGRLDLLVNAVGQSCRSSVLQPNLAQFREMMDVNYFAVVHTTLVALPWLLQHRGSLVNIATLAAKTPWPWMAPYGASKAAVANFTDNVRLEMAGQLHVLLVCPGPIKRSDAGQRYTSQTTGMSQSANRPGAGAPVAALCPDWLAKQIVRAVLRRRLQLIYPWKARVLILAQAISSRLGHWLALRLTARHRAAVPPNSN
jgi:short-subunit dehydrogenase